MFPDVYRAFLMPNLGLCCNLRVDMGSRIGEAETNIIPRFLNF